MTVLWLVIILAGYILIARLAYPLVRRIDRWGEEDYHWTVGRRRTSVLFAACWPSLLFFTALFSVLVVLAGLSEISNKVPAVRRWDAWWDDDRPL